MNLGPTLIYLIAYPGTGKYTIAKEICAQSNFHLVDNHLANNVVFSLTRMEGRRHLPPRVWENARKIWHVVLDTLSHITPRDWNVVLTNYLEEDEADRFDDVACVASQRGALFVPVRLECAPEELMARVAAPGRKDRFKLTDPHVLREEVMKTPVLAFDHPNMLHLDVTNLTPIQSAEAILNHAAQRHNMRSV